MAVIECTVGSLNLLEQLYKASTLDLVRRFSAKKLQEDRYLLPPDKLPWVSAIDLGSEYAIVSGTGTLCIRSVEVVPKELSSPVEIGLGFLIPRSDREYVCVGAIVTGRSKIVKCRTRIFSVPFDLWDFPKVVEVPSVIVVGPEICSSQGPFSVRVDLECVSLLAPDIVPRLSSVKVRHLFVITDLVSIVGKVKIRVDLNSVCYM